MTKPKVTSKLLPASSSISKLVLKETQSDAEDHQRIELMGGGDTRGLAKTDAVLFNHFVQWFQAIFANMNAEAQRIALSALWKLVPLYSLMRRMMKKVWMWSKWPQFKVIWEGLSTVQKWQRLVFLLKKEIEGTLPGNNNINLTSSGLWGVSQTWGYLCQSADEANLETNIETGEEMIKRDEMSSVRKKG